MLLDKDEKIIKTFKPDKGRFYFGWIITAILSWSWLILCPVAVIFMAVVDSDIDGSFFIVLAIAFIAAVVPVTIHIIVGIVYYRNRNYICTDKRLIIESGIIAITNKTLNYDSIDALIVKRGPIDKLLRRGTGSIYFGSPASPISNGYYFKSVSMPHNMLLQIKELIYDYNFAGSDIDLPIASSLPSFAAPVLTPLQQRVDTQALDQTAHAVSSNQVPVSNVPIPHYFASQADNDYFSNVIESGEQLVKTYRPDKKRFLTAPLVVSVVTNLVIAGFFLIISIGAENAFLLFLAFLGIDAVFFIPTVVGQILKYKNRHYACTDKRIIIRCGIVRIRYISLEYDALNATNINYSFLDRFLNRQTGTIVFGSPSSPIINTGAQNVQAGKFVFESVRFADDIISDMNKLVANYSVIASAKKIAEVIETRQKRAEKAEANIVKPVEPAVMPEPNECRWSEQFSPYLQKDEHLIFTYRPNKKKFIGEHIIGFGTIINIFLSVFLLVAGLTAFFLVRQFADSQTANLVILHITIWLTLFFAILLPAWRLIIGILDYRRRYYACTNKRFFVINGAIWTSYNSLDFDLISAAEVRVDVFDKIFGQNTGNATFGSPSLWLMLVDIQDPYEEFKKIKQLINACQPDIEKRKENSLLSKVQKGQQSVLTSPYSDFNSQSPGSKLSKALEESQTEINARADKKENPWDKYK